MIAEVGEKGSLFIIGVFIARTLGFGTFGEFNFLIALTSTLLLCFDFGLQTYVLREVATDTSAVPRLFRNSSALKLYSSTFLLIGSFVITLILRAQDVLSWTGQITFLFVLLYNFFLNLQLFLFAFLRSIEQMKHECILRLVITCVNVVGVIGVLLFLHSFLLTIVALLSVAILGTVAITLSLVRKRLLDFTDGIPSLSATARFTRHVLPYALSGVFVYIYFKADLMIIRAVYGAQAAGWYSAAYGIITGLFLLPSVFSTSLLPRLTRFYHRETAHGFQRFTRGYAFYSFGIGLLCSLVLFVTSPFVIRLIYGSGSQPSIPVLRILALVIVCKFTSHVYGTVLTSIGDQKGRTWIQGTVAATNLFLNALAIPLFGIIGAAVTTVLSEAVLSFLYYTRSRRFARFASSSEYNNSNSAR